jgi:pimeloyl-ACP methyl ester carboxylesterase
MSLDEVLANARAKHPDRSPELIAYLVQARLQTSMSAFDVLTPPNPDYRQLVSSIDVPTLLVTAEHGVVSPALAAELQSVNSKLQVETIAKAGHGIHYDQPERFAAIVKSFLHSLDTVIP